MRVVVADTSPINYLVLIDCIDILRLLYTRILIPTEVFIELTAAGAPPKVTAWIRDRPPWIEIHDAPLGFEQPHTGSRLDLDPGEPAAIHLALAEKDCLLVIDEAAGRLVASQLGVANTGTLGVLVTGARAGMIDLKATLADLQKTNFRVSKAFIDRLLTEA